MRKIHSIVIHHSASGKPTTPAQIESWHRDRGFDTIGYHAVIHKQATGKWKRSNGRSEALTGAHCKGFNTGTLGVCVTGNYEIDLTESEAIDILITTLVDWCKKYSIKPENIFAHKDKGETATACPGKNLYKQLEVIRKRVAAWL